MSNLLQTLEIICASNGASPSHWQTLSTGINSNQDQIDGFLNYFKGKLQEPNLDKQLILLDLLDYLVDQCTISFWTLISSKSFLSLMLSLLKSRNIPELQVKILYLIKKWALKFDQYKDILPNFREIYNGMINSGVVFPNEVESTYQKYLGAPKNVSMPKPQQQTYQQQPMQNDYSEDFNQYQGKNNDDNFDGSYAENLLGSLQPNMYEKKYGKLLGFLSTIVENISLANEIIDNSREGGSVDESLKDIAEPLRSGNNRLIETISSDKLKDERLMEMSLGIIEDINRTLNRYETLKLRKKPEPFLSTFTEKNIQKGISPKKKANSQPKQPQPQMQQPMSVVNKPPEIVPNVKNVNDLFDIFSSEPVPVHVPQVNNPYNNINLSVNNQYGNPNQINQPQPHPMDLFEMNPPQIQMPQMPLKPKEKSQVDILAEQLSQSYNIKDQQQGNLGMGMPNQNMNILGQGNIGMGMPNQNMNIPGQGNMGMGMPNQNMNIPGQGNIGMGIPNQNMNIPNQSMMNIPNQSMAMSGQGMGMGMPQSIHFDNNPMNPNNSMNPNIPMGSSMNLLPPLKLSNQYNLNSNQPSKLYTNSENTTNQPPRDQMYSINNNMNNNYNNGIINPNPNPNSFNNPNYQNMNNNMNSNGQDNMSESERKKLNAIDSLF